jgi:hypothetical protein
MFRNFFFLIKKDRKIDALETYKKWREKIGKKVFEIKDTRYTDLIFYQIDDLIHYKMKGEAFTIM